MRRLLIVAVLALLAAGAAWQTRFSWLPRGSHDGLPNSYRISIDDKAGLARVEASIWLESNLLSMFDVSPTPELPAGHVDLVQGLDVRDTEGDAVSLRDLGMGDFETRGGRRLWLSYSIRLEHDRHAWPAGGEEVAYRTDEGLLARVSTLLFADGGEKMLGDFEVRFELPEGWQAHTPWPAGDDALHFRPGSRRELLSNVVFLGRIHSETLSEGGVELTLVLGRRYVPQAALFRELLATQLRSYQQLFAGNPRSARYLIVINEGASGDGGAFSGSFSQLVPGDATVANRVVWGHTMAHELLHFWNGLSLVPADHREEWFKEGATDYLTIATMARNGLIDEALLFKRLENLPRRYLMARALQGLTLDLREAGKDKQPNRLLVYGGGAQAALALDAELRLRSQDKVGLPALMAALFAEFGHGERRYTLDDIQRLATGLTGGDWSEFFATTVASGGFHDLRPALAAFGLRQDSFAEEFYISRDANADAAARARFEATFAPPVAAPAAADESPVAAD